MNKSKIFIISLLIFIIVINSISCTNKNIVDVNNINVNNVLYNNLEKLKNNIYMVQNKDGGFPRIENLFTSTYLSLYNTYYALNTICNNSEHIPDNLFNRINVFMKNTNKDTIITNSTYDDLSNAYFYLKISKILNFKNQDLNNIILKKISDLQSKDGYFYQSEIIKKEKQEKLRSYSIDDPSIIDNTFKAVEVLKDNNVKFNEKTFNNWLKKILLNLNTKEYDIKSIGIISLVVKLFNSEEELNKYLDVNQIYNIYINGIKYIKNSENTNIITLHDLYVIGKKLAEYKYINLDKHFYETHLQKYDCGNGSYSIYSSGETCILATYYASMLLNDMNIMSSDKKNNIINNILKKTSYKGIYREEDDESDIYSTYYASCIIENYLKDDKFVDKDDKLRAYVEKSLKVGLDSYQVVESLVLLQLAKKYNVYIKNEQVDSFMNKQFNNIKKFSYDVNKNIMLLMLDTVNMYDIDVNKDIKSYLEECVNDYVKNKNVFLDIVNQCINIEILNDLGIKKGNKMIDEVVNKYITNYDSLDDKLYATYWVVRCLKNTNKNIKFSKHIKEDILSELAKCEDFGFYGTSTSVEPAFDTTYYALEILKYINK